MLIILCIILFRISCNFSALLQIPCIFLKIILNIDIIVKIIQNLLKWYFYYIAVIIWGNDLLTVPLSMASYISIYFEWSFQKFMDYLFANFMHYAKIYSNIITSPLYF